MRGILLVFTLFTAIGAASPAAAGGLYDMDVFLNQPHPFAVAPPPPATPPAVPTAVPPPPAPPVAAAATPGRAETGDGWISEVRAGVLKHAVAFGHTAKEGGIDANLEILFNPPDWDWWDSIWSPRPHLGGSFNASAADTDHVYGGLTWRWEAASWLFVDLALGLSVHDGMLDNSMIDGKARFDRREFGCRVLFREGLDIGWRITPRHSLSLMWEHLSHGGLCNEENEGLDNAGIRYGYRF